MSRDKYSNNHTIEILNENNDFTVSTNNGAINLLAPVAGDIALEAGDNITMEADNHITMEADSDITMVADNDIAMVATGTFGEVQITGHKFDLNTTGDIEMDASDGGVTMVTKTGVIIEADSGIEITSLSSDVEIAANGSLDLNVAAPGSYICIKIDAGISTPFVIDAGFGPLDIDAVETISITTLGEIDINAGLGAITLGSNGPYGDVDILAKKGVLIQAETDPLGPHPDGAVPGLAGPEYGRIVLEPHSNNIVAVNGHMEVDGDLDIAPFDLLRCNNIRAHAGDPLVLSASPDSSGQMGNPLGEYVLRIQNEVGGTQSDGVQIDLNAGWFPAGTPAASNNWIQFTWGAQDGLNLSAAIKGAIQGAHEVAGTGLGGWGYREDPILGTDWVGHGDATGGDLMTLAGNAQYVSGNADFGEFFEIGNVDEWGLEPSGGTIFGLLEGIVVWVVGEKFFKTQQEGVGIPMLITKRAIMVGAGRALLKGSEDNRVGEVLSFIGKLPTLVKGAVGVGDLIIPIDNENTCRGLPKGEASLQDYMKAIGSALEACPEESTLPDDHPFAPGEKATLHRLLCAVGVK